MFDPNAHLTRPNRTLIYMGACMIVGIRLAREKAGKCSGDPDRSRD